MGTDRTMESNRIWDDLRLNSAVEKGELEDDGVQLGADVDGGDDHVEVVEGGSSSSMWRTCHGPVSWLRSIESLLVLIIGRLFRSPLFAACEAVEVFCSEQIGLKSLLFGHVELKSWNAGGVLARVAGREAPSWSSVRLASRNSLAGSPPHHLQLLPGEKDCECVSPSRTVGPGTASRARRRRRGT